MANKKVKAAAMKKANTAKKAPPAGSGTLHENMRTPTRVKLFGRLVVDLTLTPQTSPPLGLGANKFLAHQLTHTREGGVPKLARIYGFSFEGQYYDLPKPAIFLVHGDGARASPTAPEFPAPLSKTKGAVSPGTVDESGVAAKDCLAQWIP